MVVAGHFGSLEHDWVEHARLHEFAGDAELATATVSPVVTGVTCICCTGCTRGALWALGTAGARVVRRLQSGANSNVRALARVALALRGQRITHRLLTVIDVRRSRTAAIGH
jgi:hypothetical protein